MALESNVCEVARAKPSPSPTDWLLAIDRDASSLVLLVSVPNPWRTAVHCLYRRQLSSQFCPATEHALDFIVYRLGLAFVLPIAIQSRHFFGCRQNAVF